MIGSTVCDMRTERQRLKEYQELKDLPERQVWLLEKLAGDVADVRRILSAFWWLFWIGVAITVVAAVGSSA